MEIVNLPGITLIGLSLKGKTSNLNGQSNIDCGNLWQKFEKESVSSKIKDKLSDEVVAVYYEYEGDHEKPFSYFIGCKVKSEAESPEGLDRLHIPAGNYQKLTAQGKMPDCVAEAWKRIWTSDLNRSYQYDFEVYGERSKDWNQAEVDIYLSV